jgi:peptide-methionine (R)-S-oxide reductase
MVKKPALMAAAGERHDKAKSTMTRRLTPEEETVLLRCGTEAPFSGALLHVKDKGTFVCKACGNKLFESGTKFDSGTGWPSFYDAVPGSVTFKTDFKIIIPRTEVRCANCGGHLGHVFGDGPAPTGKRYCINSIALDFKKAGAKRS